MSEVYTRRAPLALGTILIIALILNYFAPTLPYIGAVASEITKWATIIALFAGLYAIGILFAHNIRRIYTRPGANTEFMAGVTFIGSFIVFFSCFVLTGTGSAISQALSTNITGMITSTIDGLSLFYFIVWAYRRFRLRGVYNVMLIIGGITWLLKETPMLVYLFPGSSTVATWIYDTFVTAVTRGATIAGAVGALVIVLRTIIWRERGILGIEVS